MITIFLPDELDESFWELIPKHRTFINEQIEKDVIISYAINQQRNTGWVIVNADSEYKARKIVEQFPIHSHITFDVDELFIYDSSLAGLPKLVMN